MPWPETVLHQFQAISINPGESDLQGPYNKLLHHLFPPDTPFTVVPLAQFPANERPDWLIAFEVLYFNKPVFVLQLKQPGYLKSMISREEADNQIRVCIADFTEYCPIPTVHAVSAIGTRLCFYRCEPVEEGKAIRPIRILRRGDAICDTAPATRWDCDILDADGEARLRAVVDEIKRACTSLA